MRKTKYYTLDNILKEKADYNLIIGERSNGKTYSVLKHCLIDYINNGNEFIYLRRWKEDITGKRADAIFSALIANSEIQTITNNQYNTVVYYRGKFMLGSYDVETQKIISSKTPFCYAMSLSEMEHDKSTSYPKVTNIVFDEFLTRRFYLPDEFIIFMNSLSTVVRDRNNVKIFMLGNTVNQYSPYFEEMGLTNINRQVQDTIDVYSYGDSGLKVAVEYCGTIQKKKQSNKYFAFDNPKLNMIKNGSWEISIYPHLSEGQKISNSDIVFSFTIEFCRKLIQGDIIENKDGYFLFFHKRTTPVRTGELLYSLNYNTTPLVRRCFMHRLDRIDSKICELINNRKIFYQSNEIGELLKNYLAECVKKDILD